MRPLVILHGLFGSSRNWKSISQILSEKFGNREIRAIDLRNHNSHYGISRLTGSMDSWATLHDDLERYWRQDLNSREFDILGHSFGGQIAMTSLLQRNSAIRPFVNKIIIVDVSLRHPSVGNDNDKLFQLMKAMNSFDRNICIDRRQVIEKLQEIEPNDNTINFLLLNLVKREDGSFSFQNLNLKYLIDAWPKLKSQWKEMVLQSVPWDGQILFLKGENSDYIRPGDLRELHNFFPKHKLEVIKNSGHWPHFDNQADFVNKVINFLV